MNNNLSVLGEILTLSEPQKNYNAIRTRFSETLPNAMKKYQELTKNGSLQTAIDRYPQHVKKCIAEALHVTAQILDEHDVNVNMIDFVSQYAERLNNWYKALELIIYRADNIGVDTNPALLSNCKATVWGIVPQKAEAESGWMEDVHLERLESDPADFGGETQACLADGIQNTIMKIHVALLDCLHRHDKDFPIHYVTQERANEANKALQNAEFYDEKKKRKLLVEAFLLNPYQLSWYRQALTAFGDREHEMELLAKSFGVHGVQELKYDLLFDKMTELCPDRTAAAFSNALPAVREHSEFLGLPQKNYILDQMEAAAKKQSSKSDEDTARESHRNREVSDSAKANHQPPALSAEAMLARQMDAEQQHPWDATGLETEYHQAASYPPKSGFFIPKWLRISALYVTVVLVLFGYHFKLTGTFDYFYDIPVWFDVPMTPFPEKGLPPAEPSWRKVDMESIQKEHKKMVELLRASDRVHFSNKLEPFLQNYDVEGEPMGIHEGVGNALVVSGRMIGDTLVYAAREYDSGFTKNPLWNLGWSLFGSIWVAFKHALLAIPRGLMSIVYVLKQSATIGYYISYLFVVFVELSIFGLAATIFKK